MSEASKIGQNSLIKFLMLSKQNEPISYHRKKFIINGGKRGRI